MRTTFFMAILLVGTLAGFDTANAAGGCGAGRHRDPITGICVLNGGVVVAPGAPVIAAPVVRACPVGFVWRAGACRAI